MRETALRPGGYNRCAGAASARSATRVPAPPLLLRALMLLDALHQITRLARPDGMSSNQVLDDRTLARRLRDTFERDLEVTGVRGLHFYVQKGTVTIYGTVQHELDRELLVSFVRQIEGARRVISHLQVIGGSEAGGEAGNEADPDER